jgi:hypothetical protein
MEFAFGEANLAHKAVQMPHQRQQDLAQARILGAGNRLNDGVGHVSLIFYDHFATYRKLAKRVSGF